VKCWNDEDNQQKCLDQFRKFNGAGDNKVPLTWTVEPLQELLGHEGSIHRISWSEDGLCVASASDDRRFVVLFEPVLYGRLMICSGFYDENLVLFFFASNFRLLFIFLSTWFR
jgi:WD40 repeat protein